MFASHQTLSYLNINAMSHTLPMIGPPPPRSSAARVRLHQRSFPRDDPAAMAHRSSLCFLDCVAVWVPDLVPAGVRVPERMPVCERVDVGVPERECVVDRVGEYERVIERVPVGVRVGVLLYESVRVLDAVTVAVVDSVGVCTAVAVGVAVALTTERSKRVDQRTRGSTSPVVYSGDDGDAIMAEMLATSAAAAAAGS